MPTAVTNFNRKPSVTFGDDRYGQTDGHLQIMPSFYVGLLCASSAEKLNTNSVARPQRERIVSFELQRPHHGQIRSLLLTACCCFVFQRIDVDSFCFLPYGFATTSLRRIGGRRLTTLHSRPWHFMETCDQRSESFTLRENFIVKYIGNVNFSQ